MTISLPRPTPLASAAKTLPDATEIPVPTENARSASLCADHLTLDPQNGDVGTSSCEPHLSADTHSARGLAQLNGNQVASEAQVPGVAVELLFCAEFLDDIEKVRIASENRLRSMQERNIDLTPYEQQVAAFQRLEHDATLQLQRALRRHPLGPWVKRTIGIGEKQGARLIAAIGDILYNGAEDRPRRGPAELWAYCGYRPGQRRRKGEQSNWNAAAKMRAFLIAKSCIKQAHSPYRGVYDHARANWAERDTTDLHAHHHALRLVAKAVLRDMFIEARRVAA